MSEFFAMAITVGLWILFFWTHMNRLAWSWVIGCLAVLSWFVFGGAFTIDLLLGKAQFTATIALLVCSPLIYLVLGLGVWGVRRFAHHH